MKYNKNKPNRQPNGCKKKKQMKGEDDRGAKKTKADKGKEKQIE